MGKDHRLKRLTPMSTWSQALRTIHKDFSTWCIKSSKAKVWLVMGLPTKERILKLYKGLLSLFAMIDGGTRVPVALHLDAHGPLLRLFVFCPHPEALFYHHSLGIVADLACNIAAAVAEIEVDPDFCECMAAKKNGKSPRLTTVTFELFRSMTAESLTGQAMEFESIPETVREWLKEEDICTAKDAQRLIVRKGDTLVQAFNRMVASRGNANGYEKRVNLFRDRSKYGHLFRYADDPQFVQPSSPLGEYLAARFANEWWSALNVCPNRGGDSGSLLGGLQANIRLQKLFS